MKLINRKRRSRRAIVASFIAASMLGGGAAFAYWTSTGTGSGNVTSSNPVAFTVAQTSTITGVNPGVAAQTLSGTVTNPAGASSNAYVTQVSATLGAVTKAAGAPAGSCTTADYTLQTAAGVNATTVNMPVGQDLAPGASANWTGAKVVFVNTAVNQDGCKGATVTINYAAS